MLVGGVNASAFDGLDEMGKFLEKHSLPGLNSKRKKKTKELYICLLNRIQNHKPSFKENQRPR